jgi:hypothetical protein
MIRFRSVKIRNLMLKVGIVLLLTACETEDGRVLSDIPEFEKYELENSKVLYQYYEKFGFTDVCTHSRMYFKASGITSGNGWKRLPFSKHDLALINSFSNKVDTLDKVALNVVYPLKDYFSDISLDQREYRKDSVFSATIPLGNGYYKVGVHSFEIYFNVLNTMYCEYHTCK